jgi:hypothetical protein
MEILYFGARPKPSLTRMLTKAGYTVVYGHHRKGILASFPTCAAVVLHWKSTKDQQVIVEARLARVPSMVVTSNLVEAYGAGDPLAELYLEEPAAAEDIFSLLIDMVDSERDTGHHLADDQGIGLAA